MWRQRGAVGPGRRCRQGCRPAGADTVAARLTLVTLDCTPFDIETRVSETDAAVYSPAVLRLKGQQ